MRILMITKYPPIQGGVSRDCYWLARLFAEMGHEVTVVTNAFEVEDEYRLSLQADDDSFLEGNFGDGSIRLVRTSNDPNILYIPRNNPTATKIVGLSLEAIADSKPDFIYSHYLEPYGFSAMVVSAITGIPYVVRHAGSDVGRLMLSNQLKPAYIEVFKRAKVVVCSGRVYGALLHEGVQAHQMMSVSTNYLHPDIFSPVGETINTNNILTLGIYGKAGKGKGTFALLRAMKYLKMQGEEVRLKAHWGGRVMPDVHEAISSLEIQELVDLLPFVPHWRIPEFIRSCDVSLFLEHGFSITQHAPSVPRELLASGATLVTTTEIANKSIYRNILVDGENCLVVGDPNDTLELSGAILRLKDQQLRTSLSHGAAQAINVSEMRARAVQAANKIIEAVTE